MLWTTLLRHCIESKDHRRGCQARWSCVELRFSGIAADRECKKRQEWQLTFGLTPPDGISQKWKRMSLATVRLDQCVRRDKSGNSHLGLLSLMDDGQSGRDTISYIDSISACSRVQEWQLALTVRGTSRTPSSMMRQSFRAKR